MRRILIAALALSAACPAVSMAQSAPQPTGSTLQRVLYVCDRTPETRRAFQREHGSAVYMTAEEVLAAEAQAVRWQGPRCISHVEARRLAELRSARASR